MLTQGLPEYGDAEFSLFLRTAFIKGAGYSTEALARPIIGIANTASAYNPCHGNAPQLVEAIRRGVLLTGGMPFEFPTISIHEAMTQPTGMYLRNLMAMDTEEMLRAQPMDAVVLIGGCDKTVPAQLMGAASANLPAIQVVTGPMLAGSHRGERVGACTDCRRYWAEYRGDRLGADEIRAVNDDLVPTVGTCGVMGTASTMACLAETLGMMPLGSASAPAVTAERLRIAERAGRLAVAAAREKLTPSRILTPAAFENALRVLLAIGGSTNAILHLTAVAARAGVRLSLRELDRLSRESRVLVDLKPSGAHYMEDFHRAGGLVAVLRELRPVLRLDALTVTGRTLGQELDEAPAPFAQDVIRPFDRPVYPHGGLAVLYGNLAPSGALIKPSAATPRLMEHEGRAVVFTSAEDLAQRLDDPSLEVSPDDILVLQNIGPVGGPGMPEAGYIPIPRKLARQGVKDMVRISDGRMSGTAFGTVVLHVAPEAAIGGPLACVRTGDRIRLSVEDRALSLLISEAELASRLSQATDLRSEPLERGYARLYRQHVTQADRGCDFDFLQPS